MAQRTPRSRRTPEPQSIIVVMRADSSVLFCPLGKPQKLHQGLCQFSYAAMAVNAAATFFAASAIQSVPFSAVDGLGSPITPLGAMSRVSQAKFAGEFSGRNSSGFSVSAM